MLLSLCLLLSLAACGGRENGGSAGDGSSNAGNAVNGDDTSEDGGGLPAGGGYHEGGLGEAMHAYWFDFTVNSAYLCQEFGGYTAAEGRRLVVVDLSVKNVCDFSVDMYREDFQIEWDDENGGGYALALSKKLIDDKAAFADTYSLRVEEEKQGVLVYEVPVMDAPEYYVTFLEIFDDGTEAGREGDTFVVRLTAGDGVPV